LVSLRSARSLNHCFIFLGVASMNFHVPMTETLRMRVELTG
jgi:hypothetical protein